MFHRLCALINACMSPQRHACVSLWRYFSVCVCVRSHVGCLAARMDPHSSDKGMMGACDGRVGVFVCLQPASPWSRGSGVNVHLMCLITVPPEEALRGIDLDVCGGGGGMEREEEEEGGWVWRMEEDTAGRHESRRVRRSKWQRCCEEK